MKMKLQALIGLLALLSCTPLAHAQNEVDAIRYAYQGTPGTARSLGMGGAFGAVGSDISCASINPAGLGLYRRGEVQLGFSMLNANSTTAFNGQNTAGAKDKFSIQNIGYVSSKVGSDDVYFINYAYTYNRSTNFNQQFVVSGDAPKGSILDFFVAQANGNQFDSLGVYYPFSTGLAWSTFGIDTVPGTVDLFRAPYNGGNVQQRKMVDRGGFMGESAFSASLNLGGELFLGGTLGIVRARYTEGSTLTESFAAGQDISSLEFKEKLDASGLGFLLRFGFIARVNDNLRVGASYQSKTNLSFNEDYTTSMTTMINLRQWTDTSSLNNNTYIITLPSKLTANAAYILGENGVISADYSFTNMSRIRMSSDTSDGYSYEVENDVISKIYRGVHEARVGMEFRVLELWRLRAGLAYQLSPFTPGYGNSQASTTYSFGGGFRKERFFADLALLINQRNENYYMYDPNYAGFANVKNSFFRSVFSIGLRL
jgi:long-subunit fatty acid transport protein